MSRCSTARGSGSGLSMGGPTKVKAFKSFLFTDGSLKVGNNRSIHLRFALYSIVIKMVL